MLSRDQDRSGWEFKESDAAVKHVDICLQAAASLATANGIYRRLRENSKITPNLVEEMIACEDKFDHERRVRETGGVLPVEHQEVILNVDVPVLTRVAATCESRDRAVHTVHYGNTVCIEGN